MAKVRTYHIKNKQSEIHLTTDRSANGSLIMLLRLIMRYVGEKRPDLLAEFMDIVVKAQELSTIKVKVNDPLPVDNYYLERLMQEIPHEGGGDTL